MAIPRYFAASAAAVLVGMLSFGFLTGRGIVRAAHKGEPIPFDTSEWKTDFKKHSVSLSEIMSGGPPKDGIPAIEQPNFDSVEAAGKWLKANEPVVLFVQ